MIDQSMMSSARGKGRHPIEFIETFGSLWRCLMSLCTQTYAVEKLSSTQARFLRYIGQHGGVSQAELARATDTDPTLTGRALQTLLDRGWVRRKRSEEDRRKYILKLGATGQRARARAEAARARFAARVAAVLDERDLEDFDRIARTLFAAFEGHADESANARKARVDPSQRSFDRKTRNTKKESPT
jgi:DNA-binding MarR family transcriptional regulator